MKRKSGQFDVIFSESSGSNSTLRPGDTRKTAATREVSTEALKPQASKPTIRILIMGPSGFGKTHSIEYFRSLTKEPMAHGQYHGTKSAVATRLQFEGRTLELIDTPGFDNIGMTDVEAFSETADYLLNPKRIHKGITGVIYVHRAENTVHSRSLLRNFRVLTNIFLGTTGINRLTFLVTHDPNRDINQGTTLDEMRARGSVFSPAFSAGATVASSPNQAGFVAVLQSYISQTPIMLPVQLEKSYKSHLAFVAQLEKELGYYDYKSAQSLLDDQEQQLRECYEQQLASQRETEIQLRQQLQKAQLEYSSLRSQLQLHENTEQSEVVQTLHDLNRMIEDIGRSVSAHISDEYVAKTLGKDLADATALDALDLPELKSFVGHISGRSTFVKSSIGQGMHIESFLDYVIRNKICLYLAKEIFAPFHPGVSPALNRVLQATFKSIQKQEPQVVTGKWRAETFKHIFEPKQHCLTSNQYVDSHLNKIIADEITPLTKCVFGRAVTMKEEHHRMLRSLIQKGSDWNLRLKQDIIMLGEYSLTVHPHYSRFDPESMEEFEASPSNSPPVKILGTIALGLKCQQAIGVGNPVKEMVVCKTVVLTRNVYT